MTHSICPSITTSIGTLVCGRSCEALWNRRGAMSSQHTPPTNSYSTDGGSTHLTQTSSEITHSSWKIRLALFDATSKCADGLCSDVCSQQTQQSLQSPRITLEVTKTSSFSFATCTTRGCSPKGPQPNRGHKRTLEEAKTNSVGTRGFLPNLAPPPSPRKRQCPQTRGGSPTPCNLQEAPNYHSRQSDNHKFP